MQYYFAYGSNLHHAQMKKRCPKCRYIKRHILHNYQLTFRSKYGAADIERKVGVSIVMRSTEMKNINDCSKQILSFIQRKKIQIIKRD